jgi:HD-like signal output (HDOD) protein
LIIAYENYIEVLKDVNNHPESTMVEVEQSTMLTNHAAVGYYVAKTWGLSQRICMCIFNHHSRDMLSCDDKQQNNLMANLKVAESISHVLRNRGKNLEWDRIKNDILGYLHMEDDDYEALSTSMIELVKKSN